MKKLLNLTLALFIAFATLQSVPQLEIIQNVQAAGYDMVCDNFEVDTINADGSFNKISCASNFNDAKATMANNGRDAIVRHNASKSPSKIIAMNSGVAASYTFRRADGSGKSVVTMNIEQFAQDQSNQKTTYVVSHREMNYTGTDSFNTSNGTGRVGVILTGFKGYTGIDQVDLIPTIYMEKGLAIQLGGNTQGSYKEDPFWVIPKQSYYTVVRNGNYLDMVYKNWSFWATQADGNKTPTGNSIVLGPAESWMKEGDVYYTNDLHLLFTDRQFKKPVIVNNEQASYYNYYDFLPLRSKTSVPASAFEKYLNDKGYTARPDNGYEKLQRNQSLLVTMGDKFIDAQNLYGANALLVFSMAILESGWGRSKISIEKNNLFGWGAVDSNPGQAAEFETPAEGVRVHMAINLRGYMDAFYWVFFGSHLGNKGSGFNLKYASDPYWGMQISAIAYDIDKTNNNHNGKLTDYNKENIALIKEKDVAFKKDANTSSKTLYTSAYGATYQNDFTVIVKDQNTPGWAKVQSTTGIRENGTMLCNTSNCSSTGGVLNEKVPYNWDLSQAYLPVNKLKALNKELSQGGDQATGDYVSKISKFEWNGDNLSIVGESYQPGINVTKDTIKHLLVLTDETGKVLEIPLTTTITDNDKASFSKNDIVVKDLANGNYAMKVVTKFTSFPQFDKEVSVNFATTPQNKDVGEKSISFTTGTSGIGLTVKNKIIVLKPTIRQSVEEFKWVDNKISLKAIAFINSINFNDLSKIKHSIVLTEQTTKNVITLDATTYEGDYKVEMYDGFDYTYGWVKAEIDTSIIPVGNYTVDIKIKVGDTELTDKLMNYELDRLPASKIVGDNLFKIILNQDHRYQYEFIIEKNQIDYSTIVKNPTRRISVFDYEGSPLSLSKGIMNISGYGLIWNVNFADVDNSSHKLLFVNSDGAVTTNKLTNRACKIDYTTVLNSKFSLKNICFEENIDVKALADGSYRMYLDISTKDYHDIIELVSTGKSVIKSMTLDNRTYSISYEARDRIILTIKTN